MGTLQPGLPSPTAIPLNFYKIIIDLKDCFFSIPLHPDDQKRFAFSLPAINFKEPMQRFQWRALPQGMANSPTLCQKFVASSITPIRKRWPQIYILHYMDDILLAGAKTNDTWDCFRQLHKALQEQGLTIASDKVQLSDPYNYLRFQMQGPHIYSQKLQLRKDHLHTLNDFQRLLGDINWLTPYLQISKNDLKPLYDILQGNSDPNSPRSLTQNAREALSKVETAITAQRITFIDYQKHLCYLIFNTRSSPTAVFWQDTPIYWIHLPISLKKSLNPYFQAISDLIIIGQKQSRTLFGKDPDIIIQPYTKDQVDWLLQTTDSWPVALASFSGQIDNHYPPNKLIDFANHHPFIFPKITKQNPIPKAFLVFTDGSSTGIAAYVDIKGTTSFQTNYTSAQLTELSAVLQVFQTYPSRPLNIYTDSAYVAQSIPLLETVGYMSTASAAAPLFNAIQNLIHQRVDPFFIGHIRAHSHLPGPLSEGNDKADLATHLQLFPCILQNTLESKILAARKTHQLHHLNAQTLWLMHHITRDQARQIVKNCQSCVTQLPVPHLGVNPRGLIPNALWQMDVTHIPEFGKLKYVHVTIDTFSGFIYASLQTGEATKHVIAHMLTTTSVLGNPQQLKTDNGPGYTSSAFAPFCKQLDIHHTTRIPYNPQGQEIVERAHLSLKLVINKIKGGDWYPTLGSPRNVLSHALFILNFLSLDVAGRSAASRFWHTQTKTQFASVMWRDPLTNAWHGPDPVLIWGRGSACIYSQEDQAARWLPERLIKQIDTDNFIDNSTCPWKPIPP